MRGKSNPKQPTMRHPIQRVLYCTPTNRLYACAGDQIQCFDAGTGSLVGKWVAPKPPSHQSRKRGQNPETAKGEGRELGGGGGVALDEVGCSLVKKRKAEEPEMASAPKMQRKTEGVEEADIRTLEINAEGSGSAGGQEVGTAASGGGANNVSRILLVKDGRYLVVATNEDKTIRVFDSSGMPEFKMLSER